jgi:hypothetical protein
MTNSAQLEVWRLQQYSHEMLPFALTSPKRVSALVDGANMDFANHTCVENKHVCSPSTGTVLISCMGLVAERDYCLVSRVSPVPFPSSNLLQRLLV